MNTIIRKKWITFLLAASCIVSGVMLIYTPPQEVNRISSFEQLDSVIVATFDDHNISRSQWRVSSTDVDSVYVRKTYRVKVPRQFSKTLLHYDLNKRIYSSDYMTPSRVTLPERDMDIFVYTSNSIVRTIRIDTDLSLDTLEVAQEMAWQTD